MKLLHKVTKQDLMVQRCVAFQIDKLINICAISNKFNAVVNREKMWQEFEEV